MPLRRPRSEFASNLVCFDKKIATLASAKAIEDFPTGNRMGNAGESPMNAGFLSLEKERRNAGA